ncbi:MAG: FHA domain-containing protein [Pirellulales bacterium]
MELKLKVLVGNNAGQEVKIAGPKFFIGRAEDCHLRPRSDLISRHHCVIIVEESLVAVRDFGSKNGTLINGERVRSEQELKTGDKLKVGPLEFEAIVTQSAPAKKRPPVTSIKEAAERAASSSTDFEMDADVNKWLVAGDAKSKEKESDTRELLHPRDTEEVVIGAVDTAIIPGPKKDKEKEEADKANANKQTMEAKPAGKLPTVPSAPGAKDSFSAAAEMLRKIRKR